MKRCLPVCLLLLSVSAHGALNKWVDTEGNVHYSDEPPPLDVKAQTLVVPQPASGVAAQKTTAEREADRKKTKKAKEETDQKASKQQEEAAAKESSCNSLRANLRMLENAPRISTYNSKGEEVLMDDATRQQQMAEVRKQLANCN
ncbi:MAG: DUF4124 domain-containing protein [Nitrosomonadales bacterium]|nr:DUF4124 domain-containing protein [Nitrosomonadales bacterium]